MPLTPEGRARKAAILSRILKELEDDPERWAIIRGLWVALNHAERGTPATRKKLKKVKHLEQKGICAICSEDLPLLNSELDRAVAAEGYTKENTRLVHHHCHREDQKKKGFH